MDWLLLSGRKALPSPVSASNLGSLGLGREINSTFGPRLRVTGFAVDGCWREREVGGGWGSGTTFSGENSKSSQASISLYISSKGGGSLLTTSRADCLELEADNLWGGGSLGAAVVVSLCFDHADSSSVMLVIFPSKQVISFCSGIAWIVSHASFIALRNSGDMDIPAGDGGCWVSIWDATEGRLFSDSFGLASGEGECLGCTLASENLDGLATIGGEGFGGGFWVVFCAFKSFPKPARGGENAWGTRGATSACVDVRLGSNFVGVSATWNRSASSSSQDGDWGAWSAQPFVKTSSALFVRRGGLTDRGSNSLTKCLL